MNLRAMAVLVFPALVLSGCGSSAAGTSDAGPIDAGTPAASFSASPIDFGLQPCGGALPAPLSLAVANAGGGTLTYTATLSSTAPFSLQSGASGSLTAGGSANIVVGAAAISATATAGATATATLTLTTNDPAHPSTSIALSETAKGGVLTLSPVHVAFPATAVDSSASPFPVSLLNTGNAAVTVAFGAATNTDFGATYDGSDAGVADAGDAPVTLAPSATVGLGNLNATFTPTQTAAETATIPLVVGGAVCAGSATALTASGTGEGGIYSSQTTDLFFGNAGGTPGFVACGGSAAAPVTFTFTNSGNVSFTWQPSLASTGTATGTNYSVSPPGANLVNAGATATVTVTPTAGIPATSLTTTDLYADVLTITTNAPGDTPHTIPLHQTAFGAILGTTASIPFGSTPAGTSLTAPFSITNSGNAPATVSVLLTETDANSTTAFEISPAGGAVTSAAPLSTTVTFNAPIGPPNSFTGTLAVSSTAGVLCAPPPAPTQMTASSTNGKVALSTLTVNFGNRGLVNCGTKATAMPVKVTNSGNTAYTITPSLQRGSGSPYTLTTTCSDGSTNNVAAGGGICTISVAPETIPFPSEVTPNLYGDLLEINTSVTGDTTHYVQLNMTAQGAILTSAEAQPVAFGPIFANGANPVIFNYAFTNIGNAQAQLDFTAPAIGSAFTWPATYILNPGDVDRTFPITFNPTAAAASTASIVFAENANQPLCKPLPLATNGVSSISLTGSGTTLDLLFSSRSVDFGKSPCGVPDTNTQGINVTNNTTVNGSGETIFILAQLKNNKLYTLPTNAGCVNECSSTVQEFEIPFGSTLTFNVTSVAAPQNASIANHGLSDVLTILDDEAFLNHLVPLQNTATGAVLQFAPSPLAMATAPATTTSTAGGFFYVWNIGTQPANGLTWTVGGTDAADFVLPAAAFSVPQLANIGLNDTHQFTTQFTPPGAATYTATATLSSSSGLANVCQTALPTLTITGTGE